VRSAFADRPAAAVLLFLRAYATHSYCNDKTSNPALTPCETRMCRYRRTSSVVNLGLPRLASTLLRLLSCVQQDSFGPIEI
jgi:hypothetical protein